MWQLTWVPMMSSAQYASGLSQQLLFFAHGQWTDVEEDSTEQELGGD